MSDAEEEIWLLDKSFENNSSFTGYKNLEKSILNGGVISRKDKELILMTIFATKKYEHGMLHHCERALKYDAKVEEIIEIFEACFISRGIGMWMEGKKAIRFAHSKSTSKSMKGREKNTIEFSNIEECKEYLKEEYEEVPEWIKVMEKYNPQALLNYSQIRVNSLKDKLVTKKFKEFILIAINASESYSHGIKVHTNVARKNGATNEEISEVLMTALLTSGGPAWIDSFKYLN